MQHLETAGSERGGAFIEYVVGVVMLLAAFAIGGAVLQRAGEQRGERSRQTVSHMVPCAPGSPLAALGPEACK